MCKKERLGNCDPETAGPEQEYCIFHKPNKSEEEAVEFYRKFLERFKPRVEEIEVDGQKVKRLVFEEPVDARGFVFPGIRVAIEYRDKNENSLEEFSLFEYALFKERCDFTEAIFEGYIDFTHVKFCGDADFMFAEFKQGAFFRKAHFEKADFRAAKFHGNIKFNDATLNKGFFNDATFNGTTEFWGTIFEDVGFNGAKFKQHVYFMRSAETGRPLTFEGQAIFKEAEFHGKTYFKDVVFKSPVNFENAVFKKEVSFEGSHFCSKALFNFAVFERGASFINAEFKGDETSFSHSTFRDSVLFTFTEFRKIFFNYVIFEKGASFKNAKFYDEAWFKETKFREPVAFHDAVFCKDAKFESTFFESIAEFPKAIFLKSANFNGAIFNNKTNFKETFFNGDAVFKDVSFRVSADFSAKPGEKELRKISRDAQLKNVHINSGYKFGNKVDFSHANVTAMKFVELGKTPLESHDYETFIQEFVGLFRIPEAIIESARIQRVSFEKEGKREEADKMFVLEMRARRKLRMMQARENLKNAMGINGNLKAILHYLGTLIGVQTEKILADGVSEYGTNWKKTLLASADVIMWSAILYNVLTWLRRGKIVDSTGEPVTDILNQLYYSLVTFTTLGYGDMHPTGWLKALSAIEALTGAVFMALIVAVIARKWMR